MVKLMEGLYQALFEDYPCWREENNYSVHTTKPQCNQFWIGSFYQGWKAKGLGHIWGLYRPVGSCEVNRAAMANGLSVLRFVEIMVS